MFRLEVEFDGDIPNYEKFQKWRTMKEPVDSRLAVKR